MRTIFHIDFNSYFATVEQQANPRLRGKPIGVTGGPARLPDSAPGRLALLGKRAGSLWQAGNASKLACVAGGGRMKRTVIGAASIEAKKFGVKTGMPIWEAKSLCPQIILVKGDSDKYLETTKRFLNILKDYGPNLEVFSIDEVFLEIESSRKSLESRYLSLDSRLSTLATTIKQRIRSEIGEWMRCSIGISYNKLMAKLASSLQKPDGLVVIPNEEIAMRVLDRIELDEICGIGSRIKKRLFNMGITNFNNLRKASRESLKASFKSYGEVLYKMSRGLDDSPIIPFFEKEEVKSIGHRHTIDTDSNDLIEIKQILLKLTELIARRLRAKKLVGKTVSCWFREAFQISDPGSSIRFRSRIGSLVSEGMQITISYTDDGLEIFKAGWKIFNQMWRNPSTSSGSKIRMIGVSISNLKPLIPQNLSLLPEMSKQETIIEAIDKINDKFGEFTLQRGILLKSAKIFRKPNPYLADRRFRF